jgi:hypothetical protein
MAIMKLDCPSCGATLKDLGHKMVCEYCGKEVIVEGQKLAAVRNEITRAETVTQEVISQGNQSTQLELRKLQLTQELSMLEMQLSNLRAEKRRIGLVEKKTKAHYQQIHQVETEESHLLERIEDIRGILYPSVAGQPTMRPSRVETVVSNQKSQGVAFWLAYFLGFFGAHRFYTGHVKLGLLYLFTLGVFGFGYFFDLFTILFGKYKDSRGLLLQPMGKTGKIIATVFLVILVFYFVAIMVSSGSVPS